MEIYVAFNIDNPDLKSKIEGILTELQALPRMNSWTFNWVNDVAKIASTQTDCIVSDTLPEAWQLEPDLASPHRPPVILIAEEDEQRESTSLPAGVDEYLPPSSLGAIILEKCMRHSIHIAKLTYKVLDLQNHDALTGLASQNRFQEHLSNAIKQASDKSKLIAVLAIRVDGFSDLVSRLGHIGSGPLLRAIAGRLTTTLRKRDLAARFQDDEFMVLLEDIDSVSDATTSTQKILQNMRHDFEMNGNKIALTVSIGLGNYPDNGADQTEVIAAAKTALYLASEAGNEYRQFDSEVASIANRRLEIERALPEALTRRELEVRYQPQIELETGRISGAEALLRWYRPTLGTIPPEHFVPLAEENNSILYIGEWVLREALSEAEKWLKKHPSSICLSVNVSGNQFRNQKILSDVEGLLAESSVPAQQLELELTERVFVQNLKSHREVFDRLRELGVRIALDDFGIGYSSLNYLKNFAVDTLKIDKSFIAPLPDSRDDAAIVRAIIAMGHSLNMKIIAEGIETEAQLEFLHEQKCDEVQGHLFMTDLASQQFIRLLGDPDTGHQSDTD